MPLGPMEAKTLARPAAAWREIAAPARLSSTAFPARPWPASVMRFEPKVLLRMTRLPAST
ncbi:MAG: hypothetical protein NT090_06135 [Acidobacteria bacterium]|nr:hypothetical protein [Acidobacteriota bacterium]